MVLPSTGGIYFQVQALVFLAAGVALGLFVADVVPVMVLN